uniref:Uncharacterized protein n=1 Tax=Solanum tuberosum TaxID=4113 RepID=M1DF90_SOLTU
MTRWIAQSYRLEDAESQRIMAMEESKGTIAEPLGEPDLSRLIAFELERVNPKPNPTHLARGVPELRRGIFLIAILVDVRKKSLDSG